MSLQIQCPKCQTRLQLDQAMNQPFQVTCGSCGQLIQVKGVAPASTPVSAPAQPTADLFNSLPDAAPASRAQPRSTYAPRTRASRTRAPRKPVNLKPWLIAGGMVLGSALLIGGGIIAYQFVPENAIANLNPLSDSHEQVIDSIVATTDDMIEQLESIQDTSSRDAAITNFDSMAKELPDLTRRIARLDPISKSLQNDLTKKYESKAETMKGRMEAVVKRITDQGLASNELKSSVMDVGKAMNETSHAMNIAWTELPKAKSKHESLDNEVINLKRELWREFVAVDSESDFHNLYREVDDSSAEMEAIVSQKKAAYEDEPNPKPTATLGTVSGKLSFDLAFQFGDQLEKLQSEYGADEDLAAALARWSDAAEALRDAKPLAKPAARTSGPSFSVGGEPGRMEEMRQERLQRMREMRERYQNNPNANLASQSDSDSKTGANSRMNSSAPFDTGASPGTESTRHEQNVQRFVSRWGSENVVIIRSTEAKNIHPGELTRELIAKLETRVFFATMASENVVMAIRYSGSLDDVADHITWGKVVESDSKRRLLRVKCQMKY